MSWRGRLVSLRCSVGVAGGEVGFSIARRAGSCSVGAVVEGESEGVPACSWIRSAPGLTIRLCRRVPSWSVAKTGVKQARLDTRQTTNESRPSERWCQCDGIIFCRSVDSLLKLSDALRNEHAEYRGNSCSRNQGIGGQKYLICGKNSVSTQWDAG